MIRDMRRLSGQPATQDGAMMTSLASWMRLAAVVSIVLYGCGSQQLRLVSPDSTAGVAYTCTANNTCYPGSVASPPEGQQPDAIQLTLPRECGGRVHEIVVREPDSSTPEIDVTCAKQEATAPPPAAGLAAAPATSP
jgi:hypothetical protein